MELTLIDLLNHPGDTLRGLEEDLANKQDLARSKIVQAEQELRTIALQLEMVNTIRVSLAALRDKKESQ